MSKCLTICYRKARLYYVFYSVQKNTGEGEIRETAWMGLLVYKTTLCDSRSSPQKQLRVFLVEAANISSYADME